MDLDAAGREYVKWPYVADSAIASADVMFDDSDVWHALVVTSTTILTALVAGPEATSNPGGTIVLGFGTHSAQIRFNDSPEVVIRPAGVISVYS